MREQIDGYEQLEILLLVHGERSKWTADSISERVRLSPDAVQTALDLLQSRNLLVAVKDGETVSYQYASGDTEIDRTVDTLANAYADDRLDVMQVMNANAIERVRTAAIRTFADAFVFRPKPK